MTHKIRNIYNNLKDSVYKGDIHNIHFAVAIRKGKVISPVGFNYLRTMVFGKANGVFHAEMNVSNYFKNLLLIPLGISSWERGA